MATKAEIVQNLLNAHQITAEQAVILLTNDSKEKEYIFIPHPAQYPFFPNLYPFYEDPFKIYCSSDQIQIN